MSSFDILGEQEPSRYMEWSFAIILKNKEKAREIYYLLIGFCRNGSERR